jgi:radical SAM superfamily enzyme YgiQ (UPF0313 family)
MSRSPEATGRWLDENLYAFDGPEQYLGDEPGSLLAEYEGDRARLWAERPGVRWLLAASWPYDQAAGNIAIPAVYNAVREAGPYLADRWYVPFSQRDLGLLEKAQLGVFGVETRRPLREFDVVGTSISYTVLIINFCKYLTMSGVPLRREDRRARAGDWPMVIVGGQAYCAPEFLSPVVDCVWLGEVEDEEGERGGIGEVCEVIAAFKADGSWTADRYGCYEQLARRFSHMYFPAFTSFSYHYEDRGLEHPTKLVSGHWPLLEGMHYPHQRRIVKDLDKARPLIRAPLLYRDPGMGSGDVEVARGCTCWCVFCRLSWVSKPVRFHSTDYIVRQAQIWRRAMGSVDIALVAPDPPVYPQKVDLIARLLAEVDDEVDASSMRIDDYLSNPDLQLLMHIAGTDSITLGLEGNSQRMRDLAGKGTTDDDVCEVVRRAIRAGIKRIKLYMISNWPGETAADVMRIVELGQRLADIRDGFGESARGVRIQCSWTPLLIEAQTPLQWFAVTAPDYRLQEALHMLRAMHIDMRIGTKANPAKMAFFQACQRASRDAGEAIIDVIEAIGTCSWGGFPADMPARLDTALREHGFANGLEDLFGERFENDLLGWEHIDTGVSKRLMWRAYADMVAFLENTSPDTYDAEYDGAAKGVEWVRRCDESCQGALCGACDHKDLRLRRAYIAAARSDRDLSEHPVIPVDHTTVACRLRLRVRRPPGARFISGDSMKYIIRAAAYRASWMTGFPEIAKRTVRFASDSVSYRDRSTGIDYAEFGVTRRVSAGPALEAFLTALGKELDPWLMLEACQVLAAGARMASRPAGLWELETSTKATPEAVSTALRVWDAAESVPVLLRTDSFYANEQTEHGNGKDHVADLWLVRDAQRTVVRMLLDGKLGPYQSMAALMGWASWLPAAARTAVRLGFFLPAKPGGMLSCAGCAGPVLEGLLGEQPGERYCPRCADEASGTILAGLAHRRISGHR